MTVLAKFLVFMISTLCLHFSQVCLNWLFITITCDYIVNISNDFINCYVPLADVSDAIDRFQHWSIYSVILNKLWQVSDKSLISQRQVLEYDLIICDLCNFFVWNRLTFGNCSSILIAHYKIAGFLPIERGRSTSRRVLVLPRYILSDILHLFASLNACISQILAATFFSIYHFNFVFVSYYWLLLVLYHIVIITSLLLPVFIFAFFIGAILSQT